MPVQVWCRIKFAKTRAILTDDFDKDDESGRNYRKHNIEADFGCSGWLHPVLFEAKKQIHQ